MTLVLPVQYQILPSFSHNNCLYFISEFPAHHKSIICLINQQVATLVVL